MPRPEKPSRTKLGLLTFLACAGLAFAVAAAPAGASPWAEVGDSQLRSDIEVLAAAGVIDNVTMQWPLPWASITTRLRDLGSAGGQPEDVREAAERVLAAASSQMNFDTLQASINLDATNDSSVVRAFDALGREDVSGQGSVEYMTRTTAVRVSLGVQTLNHAGTTTFVPDNSYLAQKVGGALIYAGYLPRWWGPGWMSSLSLSNNARPFPQIGISRDSTKAFENPFLSWLGPWQFDFFVGVLDGPRIARNTIYVGTRVAVSPIPHLEMGFSRTTEMCGSGHRCVPIADYLKAATQTLSSPDSTNDEASFDFKYSNVVSGWPFEIYMQLMNEDNGPFVQSATSHLFGAGVWLPYFGDPVRLTFEYTDSLATKNLFSFGKVDHGTAYNNVGYPDGMHYRGRSLGFSLDGDSRLLSLQAGWRDADGWRYEITYYRAQISDPLNLSTNVVTTAPVTVNMGEGRISFPLARFNVILAGRLQDDQPRPDRGFEASAELNLTYRL